MPLARLRVITAFLCLMIIASASADEAGDILGLYWNPDRNGIIEIYSEDDAVYGRVIWSAIPLIDEKNDEASLVGRDMLGVPFLTGFRFDGDDRWTGGRVYAPDNGRTYRGRLWLKDGDLKMRGFVGVAALGRTATFARYQGGAELPDGGYAFASPALQDGQQK